MNENAGKNKKGPVSGFKKFMQQNQQDNLNFRTGWYERLQGIYLAHHRSKTAGIDGLQSWKKYPDKK